MITIEMTDRPQDKVRFNNAREGVLYKAVTTDDHYYLTFGGTIVCLTPHGLVVWAKRLNELDLNFWIVETKHIVRIGG